MLTEIMRWQKYATIHTKKLHVSNTHVHAARVGVSILPSASVAPRGKDWSNPGR